MKKQLLKRCIAWVLTIMMVINIIPVNAFATSAVSNEHIHTEECTDSHVDSDITIDESSSEVTDESSSEVTDESSSEVTDESSSEVTDESSSEVIDESSSEVTDESSSEVTDESSSEVTDESSSEVTDESSSKVTDESSSKVTDEYSSEVTDESSSKVTDESSSKVTDESLSEVTDESSSEVTDESSSEESVDYSDSVKELLKEIDEVLGRCGVTVGMSEKEISDIVACLDDDTFGYALEKFYDLEEKAMDLEEELKALKEEDIAQIDTYGVLNTELMSYYSVSMFATTNTVLDGKLSITDSTGNGSLSNGVLTITASGALLGGKENTITITNNAGYNAKVSFYYTRSNGSSTFVSSTSGTKTMVIAAGASISFTIKGGSGFGAKACTLEMSNFSVVEDSSNFQIGDKLYETLDAAISEAVSGNTIVLIAQNYTLPAGTYTIPAGVTLLIPFDSAHTLYTTEPKRTNTSRLDNNSESWVKPTAFCTLTMADGANLIINGAMSVSSKVFAAHSPTYGAGSPTGPAGFVKMNSGSSITVNNRAKLYAWGYIFGDGSVVAESGSTIYECFQLNDWRGGSQSINMKNRVFPMSQYYVQNIEVPMTIKAGAKEIAFSAVHITLTGDVGTTVNFFGTTADTTSMFRLASGYVIKDYDESKDRLIVDVYGNMNIAPMELPIPGEGTINSEDYNLAINSNISVNVKSGSEVEISQDIAMLPGSEIIVDSGAIVTVASGTKVYIYDRDQWQFTSGIGYVGTGKVAFIPLQYAPGKKITRTAADLVDAKIVVNGTVDASMGTVYTTSSGANISSTGGGVVHVNTPGTETVTYQLVYEGNPEYPTINITPAQLTNGDTTVVKTGDYNASGTYRYLNSVWKFKCNTCTIPAETFPCKDYKCEICGFTIPSTTDHILGDAVTENAVEVTCTTAGGYDTVVYCTVCSDELSRETTTIPAFGHSMPEGAFTCTTNKCTTCGGDIAPTTQHVLRDDEKVCTATTCADCGDAMTPTEHTLPTGAKTCVDNNCAVCGNVIKATTAHTEVVQELNKIDSTCFSEGSYTKRVYCSVCQSELSLTDEIISTKPHTEETVKGYDATCTKEGLTDGIRCSVSGCGAWVTEQTVIPAKGHKDGEAVVENNVDPTCTDKGSYESVIYCESCGVEFSRNIVEVDALGHTDGDPVKENEMAPECETAGSYDLVVYCSVCGAETSRENKEDPATGHKPGEVIEETTTDPTCINTGIGTKIVKCSVAGCGGIYSSDYNVIIPATGHTDGDAVVENNVDPTCTTTGSYDTVIYCTVCGAETSRETITVDALGHKDGDAVVENNVDPTCTDKGSYDTVIYCTVCGAETSRETTTVGALGHKDGDAVVENNVDPTCTDKGRYDTVVYCTVCGAETSRETTTVDSLGHDEKIIPAKEATCTQTGLTEGKYCERCKKTLVEQIVVETIPHTPAAAVVENNVAPTCIATGNYDSVVYCSACVNQETGKGTELSRETITVGALGHNYDKNGDGEKTTEDGEVTFAPTCLGTGTIKYVCQTAGCPDSAKDHTIFEEIPALGHKYSENDADGEITKEATCTTEGVLTFTCLNENCNEKSTKVIPVDADAHKELPAKKENNVNPTCTDTGSYDMAVYCEYCGDELSRENVTVDALGHAEDEPVVENTVEPTCTDEGSYDTVIYCSVCSTEENKVELSRVTETVPAKGHNEGAFVQEKTPTCTEDGYKSYNVCSCGTIVKFDSVTEKWVETTVVVDPATGHIDTAETIEEISKATCTENGSHYVVVTCSCGEEISRVTVTDPAIGHDFDINNDAVVDYTDGTVKSYPTCIATGTAVITCENNCGETKEEEIPIDPDGHNWQFVTTTNPTCTQEGEASSAICTLCKDGREATEEEIIIIAPLGHSYTFESVEAPTCTQEGVIVSKCTRCNDISNTPIEKLEHNVVIDFAVEATCTQTGLTEGKHCSVCGEVILAQEVISAKTHTAETIPAIAPSCTEDGQKAGEKCSVCGEITKEPEIDPATGHNGNTAVEEKAATCTESGYKAYNKCDVCGEIVKLDEGTWKETQVEVIPVEKHEVESVIENNVDPTCTTDGNYDSVFRCKNCEEEFYRTKVTVGATGHTPGEVQKENVINASCKTEGSYNEVIYCTVEGCGEKISSESKVIEKLAHTPGAAVVENNVAATCTVDGSYDSVVNCALCGAEISRDKVVVSKTGHTALSAVEANRIEATCTNAGSYDMVINCGTCKTEISRETVVIPAKKHKEVIDEAVEATCSQTGITEGKHCSVCNEVLVAQKVVEKLSHTEVTDQTVEATCYATGLTEGKHCSVCGVVTQEQTVTPKTKHTTAETKENEKAPECTTDGSYDYVIYCSVEECGEEIYRKTVTVPATGHEAGEAVTENEVEVECTKDGSYDTVVYCSVCSTEISRETTTIAHEGHKESEVVTENEVEVECTKDGSYDTVVYCSVCRAEISRETTTIKHEGHKEEIIPAIAVTCTKDGKTEGKKCSVCDTVTVRQTTIFAEGHKSVVDAAVAPTCTETGLTVGRHCSVCNEVLVAQEVVPEKGHTEVVDAYKAPTCTETGLTEGKHCSVCSEVLVAQDVIPATGHKETVDAYKAPTCTQTGLTEGKHCSVCSEVLVAQDVIPATGHKETVDAYKAPTCTQTGLTEGKHCDVCGEVILAQREISASGHTEKIDSAVEATCTQTGLTEGKHCSVCSEVLVKQEPVDMIPHTEVTDKAVEATCTQTGLTEGKHCSVCSEVLVKQEPVNMIPHTEVTDEAVEATCTQTGLTEGKHCSVCSEVLVAQETVKKLDHDWDNGRVTTPSTCEKTGIRTHSCNRCFTTKTEVEPVREHNLKTVSALRPTFTEIGWNEYKKCDYKDCDYIEGYVELPALGVPEIDSFDEFMENLEILEMLADTYVKKVSPGKNPAMLVIKYIRTGVDRYNSGSWQIMAGYEDTDFAKYVEKYEKEYNLNRAEDEEVIAVTGLKNINNFKLPNGDDADIGHVFGTMDISYTNYVNADVAGWAGDTVDLLTVTENYGVTSNNFEEIVKEITDKYFLKEESVLFENFGPFRDSEESCTFSQTDFEGDLDGYYLVRTLNNTEYKNGTLTEIFRNYMTENLTNKVRAKYFIENRMDGVTHRVELRDKVYNEYLSSDPVMTLEGTREYIADNIETLRKASCYAFADYICKLAGDYVDISQNQGIEVFDKQSSVLAPGITQTTYRANNEEGIPVVYHIATADITRKDVSIYANYYKNGETLYPTNSSEYANSGWTMSRVSSQAKYAQEKYGNPESAHYIPNYNVITAINANGYNMTNGQPSGLLVMDGVEYSACNNNGFFAILSDGTAKIGTKAEYDALKAEGKIAEAIGNFGPTLIKDGVILTTPGTTGNTDRYAARTAVGITATGKVVFMVVERLTNEDYSIGADVHQVAQILLNAGCVNAINLDGSGSTTYVAKPEGSNELQLINKPTDGDERSVSTSLMMVSTVPSSTEFDHAIIESDYNYLTVGSKINLTAKAVSATGNAVDMPEGTVWKISDETVGTISQDGIFTAKELGKVTVNLMLGETVIGSKEVNVVVPDNVYFAKDNMMAVYGIPLELPVKAVYEGKNVAINENDATVAVANEKAGTVNGFVFTAAEDSGLKKVTVNAALTGNPEAKASMTLSLFSQDEANFEFENATGGDRQLAYNREVSNSVQEKANVYRAIDFEEDMVTSYTFAIDMSQIEIPKQLEDLTGMLPGGDLEDATAWTFLLQLAKRINSNSYVKVDIQFNDNFDVSYDKLTLTNEYFELKDNAVQFDESTNTLTLTVNWIRQDNFIDPDTANPLCIVKGIELTPKADAKWTSSNRLIVTNIGEISYKIYMEAEALYNFALDPKNQEMYEVYPYIDVDGTGEECGCFGSTYKTFEDTYTLINAAKDGWVIENGGWVYYEDGEKYKGIRVVPDDGLYYSFDENGVNKGKTPYSGDFIDNNNNEYFIIEGEVYKAGNKAYDTNNGWRMVNQRDYRYYDPETGIRDNVLREEVLATCILDGHCTYTTTSGIVRHIEYDDAPGHYYEEQPDGTFKCSVCSHVRINLDECNFKLAFNVTTYNGNIRYPVVTATAPDGTELSKADDVKDYYVQYEQNPNVGTRTVKCIAYKINPYSGIAGNWRGNCKGEVVLTFEIRPDAPATVTMAKDGNDVILQWAKAKSADAYVIYKQAKGTSEWIEIAEIEHTEDEYDTITHTVTGLDNKVYNFKVGSRTYVEEENNKAYDSIKATSAKTGTISLKAPDASVSNVESNGRIKLTWNKVDGASKYEVYRATSENGTYTKVITKTGTSYIQTAGNPGDKYFYKVKALGTVEGVESAYSAVVSGAYKLATPKASITNVESNGRNKLTWNKVSGASKYEVYRSTSENGEYVKVLTKTGTSYIQTAGKPGEEYFYKVRAICDVEEANSAYSAVVSNIIKLPRVSIKCSNELYTGKVVVSWIGYNSTASEIADRYEVYLSSSREGVYTKIATTTEKEFVHEAGIAKQKYYYRVKAICDSMPEINSPLSISILRTCDLPVPENIALNRNESGKPKLTWDKVEGAVGYTVYVATSADGEYTKLISTQKLQAVHTDAEEGVTYYYKMKALAEEGTAAFSSYSEIYTLG